MYTIIVVNQCITYIYIYYIYVICIGKILLATVKGDAYCPAWLLIMRSIYEETAGGNLVRKIE